MQLGENPMYIVLLYIQPFYMENNHTGNILVDSLGSINFRI